MHKFESEKDLLSYFLIGLPMLATIAILITSFVEREWAPLLIVVWPTALVLSAWFKTYYEFRDDMLRVQSGPFSWDITVANIQLVRRSRSVLSAPALSLKRLEIKYRLGSVLISPKHEEEFLRVLRSKNPDIRIEV